MKQVYRCEYCEFMGCEKEVEEHEPKCTKNYDLKSCYTCENRDGLKMENNLVKYKCKKEIDVPAGSIMQYCKSYEREVKDEKSYGSLFNTLFGKDRIF